VDVASKDVARWRLLGKSADRLEIGWAPGWPRGAHCTAPLASLADFKTRFWVREADVATVVARTHVATAGRGVEVRLEPGLRVHKAADGLSRLSMSGADVVIALPAEVLGRHYMPTKAAPFTAAGHEVTGSQSIALKGLGRVEPRHLLVSRHKARGRSVEVRFSAPCISGRFPVPKRRVRKWRRGRIGSIFGLVSGGKRVYGGDTVFKGQPDFVWEAGPGTFFEVTGGVIGTLARNIQLTEAVRGDRVCRTVPLVDGGKSTIEVCFGLGVLHKKVLPKGIGGIGGGGMRKR